VIHKSEFTPFLYLSQPRITDEREDLDCEVVVSGKMPDRQAPARHCDGHPRTPKLQLGIVMPNPGTAELQLGIAMAASGTAELQLGILNPGRPNQTAGTTPKKPQPFPRADNSKFKIQN
jgi:hypothetical protein